MLRGARISRRRVVSLGIALALTLPVVGCGDDVTEVIQLVDCGLVRLDLTGSWSVEFIPQATTVFNCGNGANNGIGLTVDGTIFPFNDITVFTSAGNVGFSLLDSAAPNDFIGHVEADSCLMSLSFLDPDDSMYINCFGTFDIPSGVMLGGCDSASLVNLGLIVDDCDLVDVIGVTASVI